MSDRASHESGKRPNELLGQWIGQEVTAHLQDDKVVKGTLAGYDAYTVVIAKSDLVVYLPKHSLRYIAGPASEAANDTNK